MYIPKLKSLLPSPSVAIAPPPEIDILGPAIMAGANAIKSAVNEYRDAKNTGAQLQSLATYYDSQGLDGASSLIRSQEKLATPNYGAAILGIDTSKQRESALSIAKSIGDKELGFKIQSMLNKQKAEISRQDAATRGLYKARLDAFTTTQRSLATREVSVLDNQLNDNNKIIEKTLEDQSIPSEQKRIIVEQKRKENEDIKKQIENSLNNLRKSAPDPGQAPASTQAPTSSISSVVKNYSMPDDSEMTNDPSLPAEQPSKPDASLLSPITETDLNPPPIPKVDPYAEARIKATESTKNSNLQAIKAETDQIRAGLSTGLETGKIKKDQEASIKSALAEAERQAALGNLSEANRMVSNARQNANFMASMAKEKEDKPGFIDTGVTSLPEGIKLMKKSGSLYIAMDGDGNYRQVDIPDGATSLDINKVIIGTLLGPAATKKEIMSVLDTFKIKYTEGPNETIKVEPNIINPSALLNGESKLTTPSTPTTQQQLTPEQLKQQRLDAASKSGRPASFNSDAPRY